MRLLHGTAEMRWLPSRWNFALFRLYAYLRLRSSGFQPAAPVLLSAGKLRSDRVEDGAPFLFVDRHQSAGEAYSVGTWILLTSTCWVAGLLRGMRLPFALLLAFVLAWMALQAALVTSSLVIGSLQGVLRLSGAARIHANSSSVMLMLFAAAAYFAMQRTSTLARVAALQFLAFAVLNACAAAVVFLLRGPIARLESRVGGDASAS